MSLLTDLTRRLQSGHELISSEVDGAAHELAKADAPDAEKAEFLRALSFKGETAAELAAFARAFRNLAVDPGVSESSQHAIDIVGTGGDHAGGFNISTLVVLTLAAAGVTVMKHGNRGVTSKCGSADLFSGLGLDLAAPPEKVQLALKQLGYVFFFAPAYHPSFKNIAPVRKLLAGEGRRTVFNILGPLLNPGRPAHVLMGVFARSWVPRLADALEQLGVRSGLAAHGVLSDESGIDELTTATPNVVRGFGDLRRIDEVWEPESFGFTRCSFDELKGGDVTANLAIVDSVLAGKGPNGLADTIAFNAAAAMWICGRTSSVRDGVEIARESLLGGAVKTKIAATRQFYAS